MRGIKELKTDKRMDSTKNKTAKRIRVETFYIHVTFLIIASRNFRKLFWTKLHDQHYKGICKIKFSLSFSLSQVLLFKISETRCRGDRLEFPQFLSHFSLRRNRKLFHSADNIIFSV